jgi:brefeldin A-resistance guanine nucleotide exchange factor 1
VQKEETISEKLKNILFVMSNNGLFVPPAQDPTKEKLWVESWKRLDRFLPDLRKEFLAKDLKEHSVLQATQTVT